jgi:hypothetical protein
MVESDGDPRVLWAMNLVLSTLFATVVVWALSLVGLAAFTLTNVAAGALLLVVLTYVLIF